MAATVILGPAPPEVAELIERRRALGQDLYDEVWEGEYHMAPGPHPAHGAVQFAGGTCRRTGPGPRAHPDRPVQRRRPYRLPGARPRLPSRSADHAVLPSAAVVVEVLSSDDETFRKFDFYAGHGVDEIVVADPATRTVRCWWLGDDGYRQEPSSDVLGVTMADLIEGVAWPQL